MVLTRSHQQKDIKSTDKPTKSIGDKDPESKNVGLKNKKAKAKQSKETTANSSIANVKQQKQPQPDSTTLPQDDVVKDAVVMATKDEVVPTKKKSRKRYSKRKSMEGVYGDGVMKSPSYESQHTVQTAKAAKRPSVSASATATNMTKKGTDASTTKEAKIKISAAREQVQSVKNKRAKKDKRTFVVDKPQKENVNSATDMMAEETTEVVNAKGIMQLYKKESFSSEITKHKGNPKSGRKWKTEQTSRSTGMKQDKPMKSSWQKKMAIKAERKSMKIFEAELKDTKAQELENKKKHRANKIKRKLENERKSEVVQVIKNTAKMKRMKKKQLRKVEMRKIPNFNTAQIFA